MFIAVSFIIIAQTILTTTHMCISRWVDKQIVESTYSGMLFGSKKEKNFQMNLRILMWRSESYQIKERESYEGDQESFSDDDMFMILIVVMCRGHLCVLELIKLSTLNVWAHCMSCQLYLNEHINKFRKHYTFLHFSSLHSGSPW